MVGVNILEKWSQENIISFIDTIDDLVFVLDENGSVLLTNNAAERKLGYSSEELVTMNVTDLHPESKVDRVIDTIEKMLEGTLSYCTLPLQTRDEMLIPVETRVSKGRWDGKEVIFGISRDIRLRMEMAAELEDTAERLQLVIDGTNVGLWDWNIKTGETKFNERWAEIIGYSLEELEPVSIHTWMEFTHPDDLNNSREMLESHFKGDIEFYDCDLRMKHKNGNWVWIHDRGKVVEWSSPGVPLRMTGTHEDITSRKELEMKKADHQDRLEHMVLERTNKLKRSNYELNLEIRKREQYEKRLLNNIRIKEATRIVSSICFDPEDIDEAIDNVLLTLGYLTGASQTYLFSFRDDNKIMDNTHEWCDEGIKSQKESLRGLPSHRFPWLMKKLTEDEIIYIENTDSLPEEAAVEKDILSI
ncbi:PAS domain S-box-containing protein [Methanohalophilus levihalophilus]|uniref:PAS domain-containing protein n=1 Tax=Methanohalophilus levihalophilus TaxID=1431282 RepID=UPI001AEA6CFB|nr:PAS domain S-box protein [Methanohalophilus levihalophilus]MBP2029196.1 PAS domain S-box-containing protein [Methanohalophilus levihalophilus]